jgi:hypothetical protein
VRRLAPYIGIVAVLVVVLAAAGRVAWVARSELAAGRAALAAGELPAAQNHLLYAARNYLPLASASREAVEELLALGDRFAAAGEPARAVAAYDDARGALYATAWLVGPDPELLGRGDRGYAVALAQWKAQRTPGTDVAAAEARYLELTQDPPTPNRFWALVMGLSFLGYVCCLAVLAWRWDLPNHRKWPWLVGAGGGFALWVVALLLT